MNSIIDEIEILIRNNTDKNVVLELNPYSLSQLIDELGLDFMYPLNKYKGLNITINEESKEAVRIVSEFISKREHFC